MAPSQTVESGPAWGLYIQVPQWFHLRPVGLEWLEDVSPASDRSMTVVVHIPAGLDVRDGGTGVWVV